MIKKLFSLIKNAGVQVYLPGKKPGRCTSAYTVVAEDKSEISITGRGLYTYFDVSVIAPIDNYSSLDTAVSKVKAALSGSKFKFFESVTHEAGDDFNGYKKTLTYRVFKPLKCRTR